MKRLIYIFIPVLAVLLMSHNTFAVPNIFTPVTCYHDTGGGNQCINYALTTGNTLDIISVSKANNPALPQYSGYSYFNWVFSVRSYSQNANISINLGNGYPDMFSLYDLDKDCYSTDTQVICNVYVTGQLKNSNFNLQLAGEVTAFGALFTIDSLYFSIQTDYMGISYIREIRTYLQEHPSASAQDIADAVNEPEEEAAQNINDQSTSDINAGDSSSATNLLGNIQGIFNQINSIPVGNTCSIAADFGNINLGNINFCTGKDKLPFPVTFGAYCFELIFVIGTSIILIKQVLSILDWSRR